MFAYDRVQMTDEDIANVYPATPYAAAFLQHTNNQ